jgi:hypothetical protein
MEESSCTMLDDRKPTVLRDPQPKRQEKTSNGGTTTRQSRFDRLYGDAIKRQTDQAKPRNGETLSATSNSNTPRARSASSDPRASDRGSNMTRGSNAARVPVQESLRNQSTSRPTPPRRSISMDRSSSVSATTARLHAAKKATTEKSDSKIVIDVKKVPHINTIVPAFASPTARPTTMMFFENPLHARSSERLRLNTDDKTRQPSVERAQQNPQAVKGAIVESAIVSIPKAEETQSNGQRGRDVAVKAVTGSRFDTLYKDAMKRKNKDLSSSGKDESDLTFKPVISPKARSISRDRSASEQIDKLHNAPGSGRAPVKAATVDPNPFKPTISKRGSSLDRTSDNISKRLHDLKTQQNGNIEKLKHEALTKESEECTFKPNMTPTKNVKAKLVLNGAPATSTQSSGGKVPSSEDSRIKRSQSAQPVPRCQSAQPSSKKGLSDVRTEVKSIGSPSFRGVPGAYGSPTPATHFNNLYSESVKRTSDLKPNISRRANNVDGNSIDSSTERQQKFPEQPKVVVEVRREKIAPFRSPGMRSRSNSQDRRWSASSSGNSSTVSSPSTASVAGRFRDGPSDEAKLKADESRRLRAEKDMANMKMKALRSDREIPTSNILKGGTAFNMSPAVVPVKILELTPEPVCRTPEKPPYPAADDLDYSLINSDLTPPSHPGMPFGRCV